MSTDTLTQPAIESATINSIPTDAGLIDTGLIDGLREACGGAVHVPGDAGYDAARQAWQAIVDQRPAAVVYPATADEVVAVVRLTAAAGVAIVPQGTGHNANPLGSLDDAVLLRTSAMRSVEVDPVRRVARVGSGALWLDVVEAVAPYGLMALHGSSPDVGVTGYSLGGGIGWYARALGMQTNNLTAVELVLPDGRFVRASAEENDELFWAVRGGGGNFGVVTTLEMQLHPIETAYAGWLVWDWHEAHRVLTRWAQWAVDAPDEVTTSLRIMQLPPIEAVPPPLRGRQIVAIDGAVLGDDETAQRILAPLRELQPEMDTFARMPAAALVRLHGDPEGPTPAVSATTMLGSLPAEGIDAFINAAGPDSGSTMMVAELRQLGGALARSDAANGALSHLDGQFIAFTVGVPMGGLEAEKALTAEAEALIGALAPWRNGRSYSNFAEDAVDAASFYEPAAYERLRQIRQSVNPDGRVRANHRI